MKITILNTDELYHELIQLKEEQRIDFFNEQFMGPFQEMTSLLNSPSDPEKMGLLPLNGHEEELKEMLDQLQAVNAWEEAEKTLQSACQLFEKQGISVPENVTVGIFLGDPKRLADTQGYTGIGSLPGYIQLIIAPNEHNLPRLAACIAHEFHHNVLFHHTTWNFMTEVTVAKYLAVEGLAESFAAELFGEQMIGPWVTGVNQADLEKAKRLIKDNLAVKGFMAVSPYIFGDSPFLPVSDLVGMPLYGGYAVGYHAVQAYLKKTGKSVVEMTLESGEAIMAGSGYFD